MHGCHGRKDAFVVIPFFLMPLIPLKCYFSLCYVLHNIALSNSIMDVDVNCNIKHFMEQLNFIDYRVWGISKKCEKLGMSSINDFRLIPLLTGFLKNPPCTLM